jgi:hypothetical protein
MSEEDRYRKAWKDRNRRSLIAILLFFGGIAFVVVPLLIVKIPQRETLAGPFLVLMGIWVGAIFASVIYAHRFKCPRCGNYFSSKLKGKWIPPFCTHCGLPSNSPPTSEVAAAFKKLNYSN